MGVKTDLTATALLLGEPARILMLWSLLDGQARPAGELAFVANVSPQSASLHLSKLVAARMLSVSSQGRHRYYSIAGPQVAQVVESMAALSTANPRQLPTLPAPRTLVPDFRIARTCYDHLAGKVAIQIADAMQRENILRSGERDFLITKDGVSWLRDFGIEADELNTSRRALARKCLDWSERQHHIAGALGEALLREMLRRKWLVLRGERVVGVTLAGRKGMSKTFGIAV